MSCPAQIAGATKGLGSSRKGPSPHRPGAAALWACDEDNARDPPEYLHNRGARQPIRRCPRRPLRPPCTCCMNWSANASGNPELQGGPPRSGRRLQPATQAVARVALRRLSRTPTPRRGISCKRPAPTNSSSSWDAADVDRGQAGPRPRPGSAVRFRPPRAQARTPPHPGRAAPERARDRAARSASGAGSSLAGCRPARHRSCRPSPRTSGGPRAVPGSAPSRPASSKTGGALLRTLVGHEKWVCRVVMGEVRQRRPHRSFGRP